MKYVNHIIMLYVLNRYSVVCQLCLNKTGRKKKIVLPNEGRKEKRERKREIKKYLFGHLFVSGTELLKPLKFPN